MVKINSGYNIGMAWSTAMSMVVYANPLRVQTVMQIPTAFLLPLPCAKTLLRHNK